MLMIGSLFLLIVGILMLASPDTWFQITEMWKNSSTAEPSALYKISTRVGGGLCILAGVAGVLVFVIG